MFFDKFDQFTKEFHDIVVQEYGVWSLFLVKEDKPKPEQELLQGMANTNAYGVLTSDFNDHWLDLYNLNEGFRRVWGSASIQVELLLKWKYGIVVEDFQKNIHSVINMDIGKSDPNPVTMLDIGRTRRLVSDSLNPGHHLDFWLYCLAFYRLTLGKSPSLKSFIASQEAASIARPSRQK